MVDLSSLVFIIAYFLRNQSRSFIRVTRPCVNYFGLSLAKVNSLIGHYLISYGLYPIIHYIPAFINIIFSEEVPIMIIQGQVICSWPENVISGCPRIFRNKNKTVIRLYNTVLCQQITPLCPLRKVTRYTLKQTRVP